MRISFVFGALMVMAISGCGDHLSSAGGSHNNEVIATSATTSTRVEQVRKEVMTMSNAFLAEVLSKGAAGATEYILDLHSARVIEAMAREAGLAEESRMQTLIEQKTRQILVTEYLKRVADDIEPIEDEAILQDRYEAKREAFKRDAARKVSHILVADSPRPGNEIACSVDQQLRGAAERLEDVKDALAGGKPFDEVARAMSDDPASASKGGVMDVWITRDARMDPEFVERVFQLTEVGSRSEPFQTRFGFHVIQLDEVRQAEFLPFAEARPALEQELTREREKSAMDLLVAKSYPDPKAIKSETLLDILREEAQRRNKEGQQ